MGSVNPLKKNQAKYSLMTNDKGGIIDDLVFVNRTEEHNCHYMVINAGRIAEDLEHIDHAITKATSSGVSFKKYFVFFVCFFIFQQKSAKFRKKENGVQLRNFIFFFLLMIFDV